MEMAVPSNAGIESGISGRRLLNLMSEKVSNNTYQKYNQKIKFYFVENLPQGHFTL
jgi:hypothetical protein